MALGAVSGALLLTLGGMAAQNIWQGSPVIRTITLGRGEYPGDMVVDERSGHVFVGLYNYTNNIKVLMLDGRTGLPLRTISLPNQPTILAVDARHRRLLVAGGIGSSWYLSLLDTQQGKVLKTVPLGVDVGWMDVAEGLGRAFITFDNPPAGGRLLVLDSTSGRTLQTLAVPGQSGTYSVAVGGQPVRVTVTGLLSSGRPGSMSTTTYLTTLDAATGRRLHTSSFVSSAATDVNVTVDPVEQYAYATLSPSLWPPVFPIKRWPTRSFSLKSGMIRVIDLRRNTLVRAIRLHDRPGGVIVDAQASRVFITTSGLTRVVTAGVTRNSSGVVTVTFAAAIPLGKGTVLTLDAHSSRVLHHSTVGLAQVDGEVIDQGRRVLIANEGPSNGNGIPTGPSTLSVLDARSGSVLRTITLNAVASGVVADDRAGRVFLLNRGGWPVATVDPWNWIPGWLRHWLPFLPRASSRTTTMPSSITVLDMSRL